MKILHSVKRKDKKRLACIISACGNFLSNFSATSLLNGAPPQLNLRNELKSYLLVKSDFSNVRIMVGDTGMSLTLYLSTTFNTCSKSNLSVKTNVFPHRNSFINKKKPKTWNKGSVSNETACGSSSAELFWKAAIGAITFLWVNDTPLTLPVVPEEYRIAAMSDWLTSTWLVALSRLEIWVNKEMNSGESMRIVPRGKEGSLWAVWEVANAILGLLSWIWWVSSEFELRGLAGEMVTPR